MHLRNPLFLFILLLWVAVVEAQNPHPAWRNYNSDQGLPSQEVHCILQDSEGYMWFGTDNGVSRFDGYTFRNFGPQEGLHDVVVFEMLEDRRGRIWMNTMGGNIYFFEQDSIHAFPHNDTIQQYRNRFFVAKGVYVDSLESVYTSLLRLGILKITKTGEHQLFQCRNYCSALVMEPEGYFLAAKNGRYWSNRSLLDSLNRQLLLRNKDMPVEFISETGWSQTKELERFDDRGSASAMVRLDRTKFLLWSHYAIYFMDHDEVIWHRPENAEFAYGIQGEDGSIWVGTNRGQGLRKFASVKKLKENTYEAYLKRYSVTRVYRDRQGGYWAATLENGFFYTPSFSLQIYDKGAGLSTSYVSSVELNRKGEVFAGLRNGMLYKISPSINGLESLPTYTQEEPVSDLFYDEQNRALWIGSGPLSYAQQGKSNLLTFWHERLNRTSWMAAKKFYPLSRKQRMWAAGHSGIASIDLNNKTYQLVSEYGYGSELFRSRAYAIHEDYSGRVWLGLENGLYDWNDGHPERINIRHPAFQVRVEDLSQLPDTLPDGSQGTLVIGTKGEGVVFWKGDSIRQFTTAHGLTADMIENVHVDEHGQIWVGTLNGLNKFRKAGDDWTIEQITTAHGLPSNAISMVKTDGKNVWVATDRGLVYFQDEQRENIYTTPPKITSVLADQRPLDLIAPVRLPAWENNLTIQFVTLNYRMNGKVPYRFRMDGGKWTKTMNTSVNFSSMSPGERRFEVQSQNEDGVWSESATFNFHIAPPWWQTWWAITLGFLLVGLVAFAFYRYRTSQLKREIRLQKQLGEVERQALRSQMNPHFIFNSLNAIQGYIAQGDKREANRYLSRFAKLIRSALQHSRMTQVPLEDDIAALKNYLELEQLRFQGKFDFAIHVQDAIDTTEITLPPLLVQPFVENAIVHGLASKEGKGRIDIEYQLDKSSLQITVTDNGIGIEESKKRKARLASSHKSIGLSVTKRRLDMLAGNGEAGRVDIEELKDGQGAVTGTRASIWVPLEVE